MALIISVKSDIGKITDRLSKEFKNMIPRATSKGINQTLNAVESQAVKSIASEVGVSQVNVRYRNKNDKRKRFSRGYASESRPTGFVKLTERGAPNIRNFGAKPANKSVGTGRNSKRRLAKSGIKARYFKKTQKFKSGFMAKGPGERGQLLAWIRTGEFSVPTKGTYAGQIAKRAKKGNKAGNVRGRKLRREKVRPLWGPSFAIVMGMPVVEEALKNRIKVEWPKKIEHELMREFKNIERRIQK